MARLIFILLFLTQVLFGWGKTGHRIVGEIAETYLTKNAKSQIKRLIGHNDLSRMSYWADHIKSDPDWKHANDWHWCTVPDGEDYEIGKHEGLAVEKVKEFTKILKNKKTTKEEKQVALKFLVHLIGDLHQPLHVGNGTDRGGNDYKVTWFGEETNLHRVWDTHIIDDFQMSYTELAMHLQNNFDAADIKLMNENQWIDESQQIVNKVYSEVKNKDNLGYNYIYKNFDLVKLQLFKAGVRLASTLNEIFDE